MSRTRILTALSVLLVAAALIAWVAPDTSITRGMRVGAPDVKSLGAMTFGPENVLFIGDSEGGSIHAIQIEDGGKAGGAIDVTGIDAKIAQVLGASADQILISDMAVHPVSRNVYLTVTRGRGADAQPVLLRVTRDASRPIEEVSLTNVKFSTAAIPNAPASNPAARRNPRTFTVTDVAFAEGQLYVAGLSNEEFSSAFRRIPFPFGPTMATTTLEIYHVSHGRNETNAPVMTFLPRRVNGSLVILAAYTCTPLVAFEVESLKDAQHVFGRTVAELGAGNQPLDMISYTRGGKEHILIANSRHPLMRVNPADIAGAQALKSPTKEEGIPRVPLAQPGIQQLADLDAEHVVVIQAGANGTRDLKSIAKATL
jgi:hypothetical protein